MCVCVCVCACVCVCMMVTSDWLHHYKCGCCLFVSVVSCTMHTSGSIMEAATLVVLVYRLAV